MIKRIFYSITALIFIVFSGVLLYRHLKYQEYKRSISNISSINYKELTLQETEFYNLGNYNCFLVFNSECHFCIDEIENVIDNIEIFKNVNFYLVSNQTEEELIEYHKDLEFLGLENFTILFDKNNVLLSFFDVPAIPSIFFYNKKGELLNCEIGFIEVSEIISIPKLLIDTDTQSD